MLTEGTFTTDDPATPNMDQTKYASTTQIYVKETTDTYEFYLQHTDYGVIMLMYGLLKNRPYEELLDIINKNLLEQMVFYKEEYED